uniref:GDP-mannose 4,6-dehydratase n=1 Tax=Lamprocystis purpurea TaxID=61598 RepID=UPI000A027B92|nr:GDP-mannose 4,6-dehydratase [Lamprocystis purpurea]
MFWSNKRVLLTGQTDFKGSWLALWLQRLGAEVTGYALEPPTKPNLFDVARVGTDMNSIIADVRDLPRLQQALHEARPEIVLHLAAQPLVRYGYRNPVETYATNVMGDRASAGSRPPDARRARGRHCHQRQMLREP